MMSQSFSRFAPIGKKHPDLMPGCEPMCPGCAHKYLTREQSLAQKEAWVKKQLAAWNKAIEPIQSIDEFSVQGYRKRVCLSTRRQQGKWHFGLIHNETVIPIHDCPVHSRKIRETVAIFSEVLPDEKAFPLTYFVQAGAQVTLVLKTKYLPDMEWLDDSVTSHLQRIGVQGLWLHLNPCTGKKVFAKNTWHLIYGAPRSVDENQLVYGPRAFQQLIPELYSKALSSAETFLVPGPDDMLIDLYCGTGTGLARWREKRPHLIGVELDGDAVACAQENNPGITILRGRCRDRIPQLTEWTNTRSIAGRRLLYANPPRTGLEHEILNWLINEYQPDRMAYLSCSAGTLQRDLLKIESGGFRVVRIIPFDFFPQTLHVETLVFFESKEDETVKSFSW